MSKKNLVMLAILDGYGISSHVEGNAVLAAKKPTMDYLFKTYPHSTLKASGEDVGLPHGQMGNSEVGHLNLGAGRIVYQSLTRVNLAVRENKLIELPAIKKAINNALTNNSKLHIMGLLSDGGVHSHIDHILYLLEKAVDAGVKEVVVHAFLDGRDVGPSTALTYLDELDEKVKEVGSAKIGVVSGRYYAMDRDKNYNRTKLAYDALVYNEAPLKDLHTGINESYANGVTDEFVVPFIVSKESNINDFDSVIFANFRPDRAIQLSTALTNPKLVDIDTKKEFKNLVFIQMMHYSDNVIGDVVFDLQIMNNTYGEVISEHGLKQLRIAETEKYAHVTYFFDGGEELDLPGAKRILVPSPKVATYDLLPEMSAYKVTEEVIKAINEQEFDTIILNFANPDMVGHTTVFPAVVKAVEVVDECLGKIYEAVTNASGTLVVIADHGNAEKLLDDDGNLFSAHSTNPVPFIVTKHGIELEDGILADVAPTMLDLLGINIPAEMTGKSLIKK